MILFRRKGKWNKKKTLSFMFGLENKDSGWAAGKESGQTISDYLSGEFVKNDHLDEKLLYKNVIFLQ